MRLDVFRWRRLTRRTEGATPAAGEAAFPREQRSLFGEILDWMLAPLLLLWPMSVVLTWLVAQGIANAPFDRTLEYNIRALAKLVDVTVERQPFELTASARELGLLEVLLQRAGRLVSKDQLVERLCEWGEEVSNNAIEVYIHRLRKKIEKGPIRIATVRGLGYCLEKIPG